ncbi:hypothetical protein ACYOEI_13350 [Singulisphaera rosea]
MSPGTPRGKIHFSKRSFVVFLNAPTVSGNTFVEQVGSSKLFGETFSDSALTTTLHAFNTQRDGKGNLINPVGYDPHPFYEVDTNNTTAALNVDYTTVFQTSPSSAKSMAPAVKVKSADGMMEGAEMGGALVLFGKSGVLPATISTISYTLAGTLPTSQLLVDLQPGKQYQIIVNGLSTSLNADAQGTIFITGTTKAIAIPNAPALPPTNNSPANLETSDSKKTSPSPSISVANANAPLIVNPLALGGDEPVKPTPIRLRSPARVAPRGNRRSEREGIDPNRLAHRPGHI